MEQILKIITWTNADVHVQFSRNHDGLWKLLNKIKSINLNQFESRNI